MCPATVTQELANMNGTSVISQALLRINRCGLIISLMYPFISLLQKRRELTSGFKAISSAQKPGAYPSDV